MGKKVVDELSEAVPTLTELTNENVAVWWTFKLDFFAYWCRVRVAGIYLYFRIQRDCSSTVCFYLDCFARDGTSVPLDPDYFCKQNVSNLYDAVIGQSAAKPGGPTGDLRKVVEIFYEGDKVRTLAPLAVHGVEPTETEPTETEPAETEPAETEPAETTPEEAQLVVEEEELWTLIQIRNDDMRDSSAYPQGNLRFVTGLGITVLVDAMEDHIAYNFGRGGSAEDEQVIREQHVAAIIDFIENLDVTVGDDAYGYDRLVLLPITVHLVK